MQEHGEDTICIPVKEYHQLQNDASEYKQLKQALINAGTPVESIDLLTSASGLVTPPDSDDNISHEVEPAHAKSTPQQTRQNDDKTTYCRSSCQPAPIPQKLWGNARRELPSPTSSRPTDDASEARRPQHRSWTNTRAADVSDCHESRSVVLRNLPRSTTLADIARSVRGGKILNMYIRQYQSTGHVAFVEPAEAQRFMLLSSQHDLSIRGRPVSIAWDDRQHFLPGGIAKQILYNGATRNLVIRFPKPCITEEIIRDDMEHIHTLEVVSIRFEGGHFWVSLNGIKQAQAARSCMSTRLRYKGSRIEYWPDACTETFHPPATVSYGRQNPVEALLPASKAFTKNRFQALFDKDQESDFDSDMVI